MPAEDIEAGINEIRRRLPSFDYAKLLARVSDADYMKKAFREAKCNYDKLHVFRILNEGAERNDVIDKFLNEAFHIENEYIMQVNPCRYEVVPSFIIEECEKLLPA